jgi:putative nucleotidyltransferase with HDIG domain
MQAVPTSTALGGRERREKRQALIAAWAMTLVGAAAVAAAALVVHGWTVGNWWTVAAFAVVAAFAERQRVRLTGTLEESISLVPILFVAVLFGPLAAMIVGAASYSSHLKPPYLKWLIYTCSRGVTGALTALAVVETRLAFENRLAGIAVATAVGTAVAQVLDLSFAVGTAALRGHDLRAMVRTIGPVVLLAVPIYAPIVGLLAFSYLEVSEWSLLFLLIPSLGAQRLFVLYRNERMLTEELVATNTRLERANLSFAIALVATLDARDKYTAGHSAAVAIYARDIAARMGLGLDDQKLAHLCGLVHDIGKIGLPAGLLEKPGTLTLDERRQMEMHSEIGERILANVEDYSEIARIVRHHHERWDSQGYPDRLPGETIPLISRIIAVADAYNAMTSDRPYRDAMPPRIARQRLAQGAASQFDASVVAAFEDVLSTATESYRTGTRRDFNFSDQDVPVDGDAAKYMPVKDVA